jgi:uncharacterized sulfatase
LNVLLIAVDDLNDHLGCYGHPLVKSPHIDRLAKRGVRFERAYCQYPLCNPSRTSLLSGRRPEATRVFDNDTPPSQHLKDVVFLPEHFRAHGYFTARVGKIAHGRFEQAVKWSWPNEPDEAAQEERRAAQQPRARPGGNANDDQTVGRLNWRPTDRADADEPDGRIARRVVELLEEHKGGPFFIAAGFHKPHLPFHAPKQYFELYPPERIVLPSEPSDLREKVPALAFTRTPGDRAMTDPEKRHVLAAYYACTSFTDALVGVLLDALDRLKLWDNTVVVFLGDHGFHLADHGGLWRKMTLFERSARVPLIISVPPGTNAGAVCQRTVELLDLYPTITDLCGLPAPEGLEGKSMAPLLADPFAPWDRPAFTLVQRGKAFGKSVRTERWRYTEWDEGKAGAELYDHDADPQEYRNLAAEPAHAQVVAELKALLRQEK